MTPENQVGTQGQTEPTPGTPNPDSQAQIDAVAAGAEAQRKGEEPNVILARGKEPITVDGVINMGTRTVEVPSEEAQRAGFHTEHAEYLLQQYPGIYKRAIRVGQSYSDREEALKQVDAAFGLGQPENLVEGGTAQDGD